MRKKKRKDLSRQSSWFRITEEEEKHQHQPSTTHKSNFPSESRSAVTLLTSWVSWSELKRRNKVYFEMTNYFQNNVINGYVTAQNCVVIDKMSLQRVTRDKLITTRRFICRMQITLSLIKSHDFSSVAEQPLQNNKHHGLLHWTFSVWRSFQESDLLESLDRWLKKHLALKKVVCLF